MRIGIAGLHHETNTFAPTPANLEAFLRDDGWPGLLEGEGLLERLQGLNIPGAGFIDAARAAGHELVPFAWANASPSAAVESAAYEDLVGRILSRLGDGRTLDALYLDLHGAMVTESFEDGEGELLRRIREQVGPDLPICVSLDNHANVTPEMVAHADLLRAFRTYPHADMAETGAACLPLVERLVCEGRPANACWASDFLIPINWQCTLVEPARGIYADLAAWESEPGIWSLSFTPGFPPADIHHCGPVLLAYADSEAAADAMADRLAERVAAVEPRFAGELLSPKDAVADAQARVARGERPVVIADTQDNPGAGGNGDTVGLLRALMQADVRSAVLGLMCDAEAAGRAAEAGEGATVRMGIGAKSGAVPEERPVEDEWAVEAVSDGRFLATGGFYGGNHMNLGAMAVVRPRSAPGLRVVLASRKIQAADGAMFRHLGVEPTSSGILVVKSSVHFRADFQEMAAHVTLAAAPGPVISDPAKLVYRRLRGGVRLGPCGPAHLSAG